VWLDSIAGVRRHASAVGVSRGVRDELPPDAKSAYDRAVTCLGKRHGKTGYFPAPFGWCGAQANVLTLNEVVGDGR
jgi:hypothetical protein